MAKKPRERKAEHAYLDANLADTDAAGENIKIEAARAYRVSEIGEDGRKLVCELPNGVTIGSRTAMAFLFGVKTKIVNNMSFDRQKGAEREYDSDFDAAEAWWTSDFRDGQWDAPADRTGARPRYNIELVAEALRTHLAAEGKEESVILAAIARLNAADDAPARADGKAQGKEYVKLVLTNVNVAGIYAKLAAAEKKEVSTDDLI